MGNNFILRTRTKAVALCIAAALMSMQANARNLQDVRLGNYLIPGVFGQALTEGMTIPVLLRYKGGDQQEKQKVADALVVLEKGQIAESGSHAELLAHGGLYARLWQHQTGGFVGID